MKVSKYVLIKKRKITKQHQTVDLVYHRVDLCNAIRARRPKPISEPRTCCSRRATCPSLGPRRSQVAPSRITCDGELPLDVSELFAATWCSKTHLSDFQGKLTTCFWQDDSAGARTCGCTPGVRERDPCAGINAPSYWGRLGREQARHGMAVTTNLHNVSFFPASDFNLGFYII